MDRLRRSFRDSFRRRKDRVPESTKPLQWPTDEQAVRSSTCSFPVKYLGCIEVFESRGMHICEEALKMLRVSVLTKLSLCTSIHSIYIFQIDISKFEFVRLFPFLEFAASSDSRIAACER